MQPTPRRAIANPSRASRPPPLEPAAAPGAGRLGGPPGLAQPRLAPHLHNHPSLTFSLQPSHLRIPLTFSPSHRRLLLRPPPEALSHPHPPPLPPGSHLHPASSLSAPARVFSLPAHASIPGLPWSQPPAPSVQAPRPHTPEHPACRLLHPFWHLLPPSLRTRGTAAPPLCPPTPPGPSEAAAPPQHLTSSSPHVSSLQVPVRTPSDLRLRWQ